MSDPAVSLLDTNVFIHAPTNDRWSEECAWFLDALRRGAAQAWLEPVVLHELTYVLPGYPKQLTRVDVANYLATLLTWPGVQGDKILLSDALSRWAGTPGLAFVDAYLASLAARRGCAIYTKNVRELAGQGVPVPETLPHGR